MVGLAILLIDTSCDVGHVSWVVDGRVLFHHPLLGRESGQQLLPLLEAQLAEAQLELTSLQLIAVTTGPGSYTGIRLGVIAAEALAYALKIPLVGVHSLVSYAPLSPGAFVALIDARMGGVYLVVGEKNANGSVTSGGPERYSLENVPVVIGTIQTLISPHSILLKQRLPSLSHYQWIQMAPDPLLFYRAAATIYKEQGASQNGLVKIFYPTSNSATGFSFSGKLIA